MDGQDGDIATGLSTAICKDGQSTPTANIGLGGFKLTSVGVATLRTDAVRGSNIQDNDLTYFVAAGTDAYTITPAPAVTSYTAGQAWLVKIANANLTTTPSLAVSGLSAKTIVKNGAAPLAAGDLPAGAIVWMVYDGTNFQIDSAKITVSVPTLGLTDGGLQTANFSPAINTKYQMKGYASQLLATLPGSATATGAIIVLAAYGNYGGAACGTINGTAQTIQFDQQVLTMMYSKTIGWA